MSNDLKRLEKYRNELENHLEDVNRSLDEEIQQMKDRLKTTKDKCLEKRILKKDLTNKIIHLEKKLEEHDKNVKIESCSAEQTEKITENEEELRLKLRNYKKKNSDVRNEIVNLTNNINELVNEARKENILQETRSLRSCLEKIRAEMDDLMRKKTAQDSAIERLRADIAMAEESQTLLDSLLENEINRRFQQSSEAVELQEQMDIFEKENVNIQDEFNNLLNNLKEKDMRITRLENEVEEKKKRFKKINQLNEDYLEELRTNIERTQTLLRQQEEEVKKCEQFLKTESINLKKLEKKYKGLKEKKCLKEESDESDMESESDFDRNLKEVSKKHEMITNRLLNKRKTINSSLTTKKSSSEIRENSSNLIPSMKKTFLNLKREQKALEFKAQALAEKKNLLTSKVESLLKENERTTSELKKSEEIKENLTKDITNLENASSKGIHENKEKTENERKFELVTEAIRKQTIQNDQLRQKSEQLKKNLSALQTKIRMLGDVNVEEAEKQREEERILLRRLKNSYSEMTKKAKKTERELELCIIQRESTVNRAHSVVHLVTTVKAEREVEIKDIRKRVSEKRQVLETALNGFS